MGTHVVVPRFTDKLLERSIMLRHCRIPPDRTLERPNGMPYWMFWYTTKGKAVIQCPDGNDFATEPGDLVLWAPDTPQLYGTAGLSTTWYSLWGAFEIRPHWYDYLRWPARSRGIHQITGLSAASRRQVVRLLREADKFANDPGLHNAYKLALNRVEEVFLWIHENHLEHPLTHRDPRVLEGMRLLCDDIRHPWRMPEFAAKLGVSIPHINRLFRDEIGQTPMAYLEDLRMTRARELLIITALPIAEVARETGYDNPFYFSHRYHVRYGHSPRKERNIPESEEPISCAS